MKIKELNIKQIRDLNKDGWAVFVAKNKEMFVYRGGWPTPEGITWTEVVHVLDPYRKGTEPHHSTFVMKKLGMDSDSDRAIIYREL